MGFAVTTGVSVVVTGVAVVAVSWSVTGAEVPSVTGAEVPSVTGAEVPSVAGASVTTGAAVVGSVVGGASVVAHWARQTSDGAEPRMFVTGVHLLATRSSATDAGFGAPRVSQTL